jgi:phosphopantetheinyl transferase (holo-ACP synthase)
MWSFDPPGPLLGCGIDSEKISRFEQWRTTPPTEVSLLFARPEIIHCQTQIDPRQGLCAAFCCKEAIAKAIGSLYDFTLCRLLWLPRRRQHSLWLDPELSREYGIGTAMARIHMERHGTCTAAVFIFG